MLSLSKHLYRSSKPAIWDVPTRARCFGKLSMTAWILSYYYFSISATSSGLRGFTFEG